MQAASASAILHCLKPNVFPIINNVIIDTAVLLESEGVLLVRPKHLATYIENVRRLKKFRDEKCTFRNYRALDLKLQEVEELEEKVQFNDPIDISKEQWMEMLSNPDVFRKEDVELVKTIYKMEGEATASELSEFENTNPFAYNFPVVHLAKRIHRYTNCTVPKRKNGKERWWHVPFLGRYREDKTFSWILRPELKEAIKEKYFYLEDEEEEVNISEPINYWWLTADPNIWSFDNVKIGQTFTYSSRN